MHIVNGRDPCEFRVVFEDEAEQRAYTQYIHTMSNATKKTGYDYVGAIKAAVDVLSTVAVLAFCAGGGWVPIAVGFGIGLVAEGAKIDIDYWFKRKKQAYSNTQ